MDQFKEPVWTQWHVEDLHIERGEGILDGLCEQRTHRNGTRLACSFYA